MGLKNLRSVICTRNLWGRKRNKFLSLRQCGWSDSPATFSPAARNGRNNKIKPMACARSNPSSAEKPNALPALLHGADHNTSVKGRQSDNPYQVGSQTSSRTTTPSSPKDEHWSVLTRTRRVFSASVRAETGSSSTETTSEHTFKPPPNTGEISCSACS